MSAHSKYGSKVMITANTRFRQLAVARKRLDSVNLNLERVDENMRHFLSQIDQLQYVAKISAEVDTVWPDLERLQTAYNHRSRGEIAGDDEDTVAPLRASRDGSIGLDKGPDKRLANGLPNGNARPRAPRRKTTFSNPLPPIYNFGIKPWPRRSSLDPTGTNRVNPVRRMELTLEHARSQGEDMLRRRGDTTRELQSMIGRIDALIRQKDAVRSWTKAALEENRFLQYTVDSLHRQIRGDSRARMGRLKDRIYDTLVRQILSPLFRGIFGVFHVGRWVWSLRSSSSRQRYGSGVRGLKNMPWGVWGFGAVVVGLVAVFWYIGG